MKNRIRQVFHSGKFITGFVIFIVILLTIFIYPLIITRDPLKMMGEGNFFRPGTYVSKSEVAGSGDSYQLNVDAAAAQVDRRLKNDTRGFMAEWLEKYGGVKSSEIDVSDADGLIALWQDHYDLAAEQKGMTAAKKKKFRRLDKEIRDIMKSKALFLAEKNEETGDLEEVEELGETEYVNEKDIQNKHTFPLGTDNFGRDVLTELVAATRSSLKIGVIAGVIATVLGLILGLLAGYLGGFADNLIVFFTNLFTVIPSFVLLILISYSVGESQRGIMMVAILIGCTSWPWTTRSVRSQVMSLRNRDHVNLSKLSGHSTIRIILTDILPYIASYVVMAFILQISSGILSEAQLSMIGLGPATTKTATLGLMMNWATMYSAHLNGSWWAYFPVVLMIALISFSLNLMNTGLDQVFNPQLRD
ncbi:ABC transporter permease [Eubacteriales bacterium mix99]|jgi:ABC-type dipeptide/oligopeptide/nickel transport system permease subunit